MTTDIEVLPESEYVESQRCLRLHAYQSVKVLDEQRLIFKGRGGKVWLNQLKGRCQGLRRRMTLEFTRRDSRLCELDDVRGVDQDYRPMSARCALGAFEPITEQQLDLLEDVLKER
jgi:hypothetical protein